MSGLLGEDIGKLADKADNFLHIARLPMPANEIITALLVGLQDLRTDLRVMAIEYGIDPETWTEEKETE